MWDLRGVERIWQADSQIAQYKVRYDAHSTHHMTYSTQYSQYYILLWQESESPNRLLRDTSRGQAQDPSCLADMYSGSGWFEVSPCILAGRSFA